MRAGSGLRLDLDPGEAAKLRAQARLAIRRAENEARYALHPWPFIRECVWTLDQRGDGAGVKKFPAEIEDEPCRVPVKGTCRKGGCKNYLEHMVRVWFRMFQPGATYNTLGCVKSRRVIGSWTLVSCHYWLARYRPAQMIAFGARKLGLTEDEGSAELVKRVKFIHDHLPLDVAPRKTRYGFGRFAFKDNDSTIIGVAQGADQARQYTFSAYLADEFAFWEHAAATHAALAPTLEGGGKFTYITSAAAGYAEQVTFDRWNATE